MAENKKSFILYCDIVHTIGHLTDDQAGKLFKHILNYVNDKKPVTEDVITNLAFEPIKQQLKRDLNKWSGYIDKQRVNGAKGGRPKETQKTQAFLEKPKKADNANVTVNVNDNVNVIREGEPPTKFLQSICNNAEETILKNEIEFQRICAGAGIDFDVGKVALHKYHLHLEEKEQYPRSKKSVFSGFEKWMANEKQFIKNGTHKQPSQRGRSTSKSDGANNLLESIREDYKRSG